jgi:hypothetical protein
LGTVRIVGYGIALWLAFGKEPLFGIAYSMLLLEATADLGLLYFNNLKQSNSP